MAPIDDALAELESLEPGEEYSYRKIAAKYGVVRSTLTRRHQGLVRPAQVKNSNQQKLTPEQEQELVQYIKGLTERHLPPTREMIRNFASTIAKEPVSESWVDRFINRYNIHLISRWTAGMDSNRHNTNSEDKYRLYFNYLHGKINKYQIDPRYTYNMDEKGFLIGIISRLKRIFSRQMWEKKEVTALL